MPTTEQILAGLAATARDWKFLAVLWHVYFAAFGTALLLGARPPRRLAGLLLALPLVSVSVVAWATANPFNGIVYAVVGLLAAYFAMRLPRESVRIATPGLSIPGVILFLLGFVYPHFLDGSFLQYVYSAPVGLIPCPTLTVVIGLALALDRLGSRALSALLGVTALFYGVTGVVQLGVLIDAGLVVGAAMMLILAFKGARTSPAAMPS